MFDITKLIFKIPGYLDSEECDNLIQEFESRQDNHNYEHCNHAVTGKDTYSTFKALNLIPGTQSFNFIKKKNQEVIHRYLNYLESSKMFHVGYRKQLKYSHLYRLLKYEKGAKIHPHTDHAPYIYGSISFNLNDDYKGGKFRFFNGKYEVPLGKGDVIIWPADFFWVHEVTPIEEGVRYSTNGFLTSIPLDVIKHLDTQATLLEQDYLSKVNIDNILGPYV